MSFIEIHKCRICGNTDLIPILDLGDHVISSRFPSKEEKDPPSAPLSLVKCNDFDNDNCGLLQLKHNVFPDELYLHHYGYRSGLNRTMTNHLKGLANQIETMVKLNDNDIILDIGSNDATLLKSYNHKNVNKIGIDPTGKQFKKFYPSDIKLVCDFFNAKNFENVFPTQKAKVITTISMFYDLPDPLGFMYDLKKILAPDGIWVTEQSYMITMLEKNSFDTICHEHLEYYAFKQIKWMADKVGLKIIDVLFNDCNGGSFRIFFSHQNNVYPINTKELNNIMEKESNLALHTLKPFTEFNNRCEILKEQLVFFLKYQKETGKNIHIYGASTKGNTLLQYYNIDNTIITAAGERNPEKYGRRTPKTNIPIISEEEMRLQKPDFLLVLPWHFKEEFLEREKEYLSNGGQYIFPLPYIDIVSSQKTALITGINGQIGSYLKDILLEKNYIVFGLVHQNYIEDKKNKNIFFLKGDLLDVSSLEKQINMLHIDEFYNLAAETDALVSIENPVETLELNGSIVMKLCEIFRKNNKQIKYFQANSAELYKGLSNCVVTESNLSFYPKNPYALGKLIAYWTMIYYREKYHMYCVNGIIFNAESPLRRESYMTRKVSMKAAKIKHGDTTVLSLGNLDASRDWIHAYDAAYACWLTLQQKSPSDYNISSGTTHTIRKLVEYVFEKIGIQLEWLNDENNEIGIDKKNKQTYVHTDPAFFRSYETKKELLVGDNTKLKNIGWTPKYTWEQLIEEMLNHDIELLK